MTNIRVASWKNAPIDLEAMLKSLQQHLDERAPLMKRACDLITEVIGNHTSKEN